MMNNNGKILADDARRYIEIIDELKQINTDLEFLESLCGDEVRSLVLHINPGWDFVNEKLQLTSVKKEAIEEIKRILYAKQLELQMQRNSLTDKGAANES